jgi:prophage maintenance system killer protein
MVSATRALLRPPFFVRKPALTAPSKKNAALMESFGNNHGFLDANKRIAYTATDVCLRRNGFCIEVEGLDGYAFIDGSMDRHEFRFAQILDWIRQHIKPLIELFADIKMAAPKSGRRNKDNSSYQRKMVILWIKAVMEPLPPLAPSSWKLISKSPCAQPKCSAE